MDAEIGSTIRPRALSGTEKGFVLILSREEAQGAETRRFPMSEILKAFSLRLVSLGVPSVSRLLPGRGGSRPTLQLLPQGDAASPPASGPLEDPVCLKTK